MEDEEGGGHALLEPKEQLWPRAERVEKSIYNLFKRKDSGPVRQRRGWLSYSPAHPLTLKAWQPESGPRTQERELTPLNCSLTATCVLWCMYVLTKHEYVHVCLYMCMHIHTLIINKTMLKR